MAAGAEVFTGISAKDMPCIQSTSNTETVWRIIATSRDVPERISTLRWLSARTSMPAGRMGSSTSRMFSAETNLSGTRWGCCPGFSGFQLPDEIDAVVRPASAAAPRDKCHRQPQSPRHCREVPLRKVREA